MENPSNMDISFGTSIFGNLRVFFFPFESFQRCKMVMACAAGQLYNSSCSCFPAFLQLLLGTVSHFYGCLLYSPIMSYSCLPPNDLSHSQRTLFTD